MNESPTSDNAHTVESTVKLTERQNEKLLFFRSTPMSSANRLLKQLYEDDSFYETATFAWVSPEDAKKLFLFGVCKEVLKTCVGLINDAEFLREGPSGKNADLIVKMVIGSITDIQTYRIRKMVELLSLVLLFRHNAKRGEEYRIFLSAENMDLALARQEDFRELYEKRTIHNTQHLIDDFADRIERDMKELGVTEIWFLEKDKLKRKRPSVFKTKKALYLGALLVATAEQKLALGISYGRGYSRTSQSVHPLLGSHEYGAEENSVRYCISNFTHLSIICMNIMHLAYEIAGIEDPEGLTRFMGKNFENSAAPQTISKFAKEFQAGDFVLTAYGGLAEIVEEHVSKYGYRAYKVRYISRPPLPQFPEDWLEAHAITARLLAKDKIRSFFEKNTPHSSDAKTSEMMSKIKEIPDDELFRYAKDFFLEMHNRHLLVPMLLESGFLKMEVREEF